MTIKSKYKSSSKKSQELINARKNAKAAKRYAEKLYKDHVKEMRPYLKTLRKIDLRRNLNGGQKSFVTKAFKDYQELTLRPTKIYRTKNKKKLNLVQQFSRHDPKKTKFDVAFVPSDDPHGKVIVNKNSITVKSRYVSVTSLLFDQKKLAINPDKEIARVLAMKPHAQQFVIMAGAALYNGGLVRSLVNERIQKLMMKYSDETANNFYKNWLLGLQAYKAHNQKEVSDYLADFHKQNNENKRLRNNERKRIKRKQQKLKDA